MLSLHTLSLGTTELLQATLPALCVGLHGTRWQLGIRNSVHNRKFQYISETVATDDLQQERLPTQTPGGDASVLAAASCSQPGGLRPSKLCRLTGLCSRTKINIVNTNMRCPSCLVEHLSKGEPSTLFPAVSIDQTVQLLHPGPSPDQDEPLTPTHALAMPNASVSATIVPSSLRPTNRRNTALFACQRATAELCLAQFAGSTNKIGGHEPAWLTHYRLFTSAAPPGSSSRSATAMQPSAGSAPNSALTQDNPASGNIWRSSPTSACEPTSSASSQGHNFVTSVDAAPHDAITQSPAQAQTSVALLQSWFGRVKGRAKGISRKFVFRTLNKRIIRQMARRATIGFPIIGFFFVSRLLVKDFERVRAEASAGRNAIAGLFSFALACDAVDLVSQGLIIAGLAHANFGLGPGVVAHLLSMADSATVAMAVASFSAGVSGELLTVLREETEAAAAQQAEGKSDAGGEVKQKE